MGQTPFGPDAIATQQQRMAIESDPSVPRSRPFRPALRSTCYRAGEAFTDRSEMMAESTCPTLRDGDEEVARQWAAGALPPEDAAAFDAHLRTCGRCQHAVERAAGVTAALRAAAASHVRPAGWPRWALPVAVAAGAAVALWLLSGCQ